VFEKEIQPLIQSFFELSTFDENPIAEGFWEEIFDLSVKLYARETGDSPRFYSDI